MASGVVGYSFESSLYVSVDEWITHWINTIPFITTKYLDEYQPHIPSLFMNLLHILDALETISYNSSAICIELEKSKEFIHQLLTIYEQCWNVLTTVILILRLQS